jgi:hypothetical protein
MFRPSVRKLIRSEAVLHLQDGQTTIRGFLLDFYNDGSIRLASPTLMTTDDKEPTALGGEALVFQNEIKFIQLLSKGS